MTTKTRKRVKKAAPKSSKGRVPPLAKQILVRTSERSTFQVCQHLWQWSYIEQRKPLTDAPALRFGDLIHKALEKRYPPGIKRGPHPTPIFEKLYEAATKEAFKFGFRDEDGEWSDAGELGAQMLNAYVDKYGKDEEWKVVASEQTFAVPVFDPDTGLYLFTYVGTIDGVWENRMDAAVRIIDHKTTTKDPIQEARNPGYNGSLSLQAGAYWTYGVDHLITTGVLKPKLQEALYGMVFSYLRKAKEDERPQDKNGQYLNNPSKADLVRYANANGLKPEGTVADLVKRIGPKKAAQLGEVSKNQPPPNFHREIVYRSEADRERYRARAIRQVKLMIELRGGPPEDRIKSPHWLNCNMCSFKDACELHEADSNWEDFLEGSTQDWNPYDAHEIEQEGK